MTAGAVKAVLTPLVSACCCSWLWQFFVEWRDIKPFLLPKPTAIWDEIADNASEIWKAARRHRHERRRRHPGRHGGRGGRGAGREPVPVAGELLTPLSAAVNAIPIIVLAPIFNNIFSTPAPSRGADRRRHRVLPDLREHAARTGAGRRHQDELMRSYGASDWVHAQGRVPERAAVLLHRSEAGRLARRDRAVVAEYFGGLQNGSAAASRRTPAPPTTRGRGPTWPPPAPSARFYCSRSPSSARHAVASRPARPS
jgi:NitT/TauT family transport system permease protein